MYLEGRMPLGKEKAQFLIFMFFMSYISSLRRPRLLTGAQRNLMKHYFPVHNHMKGARARLTVAGSRWASLAGSEGSHLKESSSFLSGCRWHSLDYSGYIDPSSSQGNSESTDLPSGLPLPWQVPLGKTLPDTTPDTTTPRSHPPATPRPAFLSESPQMDLDSVYKPQHKDPFLNRSPKLLSHLQNCLWFKRG